MNYYNDFDKKACAWLRELVKAGKIPDGIVDDRSITDVTANDLRGFTQCHFFAGIGGWSLSLQLAGWPEDKPVWTGSCPCQPFSVAGKGDGKSDERHLWPAFARLIAECRPPVVFGEQVESAIKHGWIDDLQADMEREDYAVGFAVLGAHSVGAPHIRQRLYWVADSRLLGSSQPGKQTAGSEKHCGIDGLANADGEQDISTDEERLHTKSCCKSGAFRVEDTTRIGWGGGSTSIQRGGECPQQIKGHSDMGGLADADGNGLQPRERDNPSAGYGDTLAATGGDDRPQQPREADGCWDAVDWLFCRDGKWRPVESGTFPLADGVPGRVGLLRGYGNAIVPQVAAEFVKAFMEVKK